MPSLRNLPCLWQIGRQVERIRPYARMAHSYFIPTFCFWTCLARAEGFMRASRLGISAWFGASLMSSDCTSTASSKSCSETKLNKYRSLAQLARVPGRELGYTVSEMSEPEVQAARSASSQDEMLAKAVTIGYAA